MGPDQYERATRLFSQMCQRPAGERKEWLSRQADDVEVLELVRELEARDRQLGGSIDSERAKVTQPDTEPNGSTLRADSMLDERAVGDMVVAGERLTEDYVDLVEIGRGGFGSIYRAHQVSLNRAVAIKMIRRDADASSSKRLRFQLEAEASAQLDHPNIVPIYEIGGGDSTQFFAMKLIDGVDLAQWLRAAQRPQRQKVEIVRKVARAIHYAHQNGVLHRDVKPANILIDSENEPHVTDFGLAKHLGADVELTVTGQIMGTPRYMSPEQASGAVPTTIATDVYGLGVVLYECLVGQPPLVGENMFETIKMVAETEPDPPSTKNPDVDRDLETVCMKCLAKEPEQRYQSADELAQELGRWLREEPIHARPISIAERCVKWVRRNRSLAAMAASLVTIVTVALGVVGWLASSYLDSLKERRVANAVQGVRDADVSGLQSLKAELVDDWEAAEPRLTDFFEKAADQTPEKLNLALLLSTRIPSRLEYVIGQLEQLDAVELETAIEFMRPHANLIAGNLIEIFQQKDSNLAASASSRAAAAAALIKLNLDQVVWPSLGRDNDMTDRNSLIHGLADSAVDTTLLAKRLEVERDPAVRRAIVQIAASSDLDSLSESQRGDFVRLISRAYETDPDPAVHSSAWLALRRWNTPVPQSPPEQAEENAEIKELAARVVTLKQQIAVAAAEPPSNQELWEESFAKKQSQPPADYVVRYSFDNAENRFEEEVSGTGGQTIGTGSANWYDGVLGKAIHVGDENTIEGETSYYPDVDKPFSMGAWIHREVNVDTDEYGTVFSRSVPGDAGFDLWIDDGTIGMHLVSISTGGWMLKVAGTRKLPTNTWIHVFATYNGSRKADGVRLYVNGSPVEKKVFDSEVGGSIASDAPFCIGQRYDGGRGTSQERFPFHGAIDEVRLYDRELTDFEVNQLYEVSISQICQLTTQSRTAAQKQILRQHHQTALVDELRQQLSELIAHLQERRERWQRRWFSSQGGPMFAMVSRPGIRERLPYSMAIATCPITVEQYQRFDDSIEYDQSMAPMIRCPINSVSRHDAAAYCNWLSEQDGIPPEQWCYLEVDYEVIADPNNMAAGQGHQVFYKERLDARERSGYRLPTLDEWHFACLAGAQTLYSFGSDVGLFAKYGWSSENSGGHTHPVGTLLPNDFGIFGMHGGLWEWTSQGMLHDCRLVGGSIYETADQLKFDISHSRDQFSRDSDKTFRVVRTMK